MRKLIQITSSTAPDGDGATTIFLHGLCDDGTAWELFMGDNAHWDPLPPIPQESASPDWSHDAALSENSVTVRLRQRIHILERCLEGSRNERMFIEQKLTELTAENKRLADANEVGS